jgi:hypothetical protein
MSEAKPAFQAGVEMKIVIETPVGTVTSGTLRQDAADEVMSVLVDDFKRLKHLVLSTPAGPVFIPKGVLEQSVVRFIDMPSKRVKRAPK